MYFVTIHASQPVHVIDLDIKHMQLQSDLHLHWNFQDQMEAYCSSLYYTFTSSTISTCVVTQNLRLHFLKLCPETGHLPSELMGSLVWCLSSPCIEAYYYVVKIQTLDCLPHTKCLWAERDTTNFFQIALQWNVPFLFQFFAAEYLKLFCSCCCTVFKINTCPGLSYLALVT